MKHFFLTIFLAAFAISGNAVYLQNFENMTDIFIYEDDGVTKKEGLFFVHSNSFAPLMLTENPKKAGINTSENCVAVNTYLSGFSPNSGIIKISFSGEVPVIDYPVNPLGDPNDDETPVYYDVLRFKYYKGNLKNKNVEFEPNGQPMSPKALRTAMGEDEWEYITFTLEYKKYSNFQIRVNRNEDGTGAATGTGADELIYVDDFEIYNSDVGPDDPSAIKLAVIDENVFSCIALGNNQFRLDATIDKPSNVQVDLVSLNGQVSTIYNQATQQGAFELPFQADNQGVYFVRMIIDGKQVAAKKIIAR